MTAPAQHLLGGTDKAAIMVMLLAEEDASRILSQLTPDELRQLAGTMCGIGEVEPQAISDARKELADARSAQKGAHLKGAVDVRSIIKKADALPDVEKVALGPDFDDEEEVPPLQ